VQCPLSGGHLSELIDEAWLTKGHLTQVMQYRRYKCLSRRRTFRSLRLKTGPRSVQLTKVVRMRCKKKDVFLPRRRQANCGDAAGEVRGPGRYERCELQRSFVEFGAGRRLHERTSEL
jgi:hypothetical protein